MISRMNKRYIIMLYDRIANNTLETAVYDTENENDVITIHLNHRKDLPAIKQRTAITKKKNNTPKSIADKIISLYAERDVYINIVEIPTFVSSITILFDNYINKFHCIFNANLKVAITKLLESDRLYNLGTRIEALRAMYALDNINQDSLLECNFYTTHIVNIEKQAKEIDAEQIVYTTLIQRDEHPLVYLYCKDNTLGESIEVIMNHGNRTIECFLNQDKEIQVPVLSVLAPYIQRTSIEFRTNLMKEYKKLVDIKQENQIPNLKF